MKPNNLEKRLFNLMLVIVEWADAKFNHDYITVEKAEALRPAVTFTLGHLVANTEHGITLAMSTFRDEPDQFSEYLFVPKMMIVRVTELSVPVTCQSDTDLTPITPFQAGNDTVQTA